MSDGGKEDVKRDELGLIIGSDSNCFNRAVSRIAVAQICECIGFEGINDTALDSLADIVIKYLRDLAKSTKFYANLAGRTECNVFDIMQGLVDFGMTQGFLNASEVSLDLVASLGVIRELEKYVASAEELPFTQPITHFPVTREPKSIPTFLQMGETPSSAHIPGWLPAFPDSHTYLRTPVWNERLSDPRADKIELVRQHTKAERSLLSLQQRLVRNGSSVAAAATSTEHDHSGNGLNLEVYENETSVIAKPLQNGDRETVPVKLSGEAHKEKLSSLLDTFAPAIEAMKDGIDSGSDCDKIHQEKRSSLFMDFKGGKKLFGESLDLRIHRKASTKAAPWFGFEDEKDDKRRRVDLILRKSVENQQELFQL